jgi:soluble lytic murein transglycosylase-like protein
MDILRGDIKMQPESRDKLLNNMPQSDPRYAQVQNGKSKQAVKAFLEYQKSTWEQYKKDALTKINDPQNIKVKQAIEKAKVKVPEFSKDFITTVAYKESRFNPDPKTNKAYRGLFQIGDSAWSELKRIYPIKYKGVKAPLSPIKNTEAGCDYLKLVYDRFENLIKH